MIDLLDVLRETLAPRYAVERLIGVGGMARVYLATEQHPHRQVAIKVMDPEISTRLARERFVREVEVSSRLSHPHIVPVLAADECRMDGEGGRTAGLCYYVMPYVEGESLRQRLLHEAPLGFDQALHIAGDVADALSYAHAHGVIHRDIKPENILLSGDHALVADFGVARAISAAGGATLTAVGQQIGSPAYMSPEQLAGSRRVDLRTDIYSLGCVLYEVLAGEPPLLDLAGEASAAERRSLDAALRRHGVPRGSARAVNAALSRALAPFPEDRFQSAAEFAAALPTTSHQARASAGVTPPRNRRRMALVAGAVIALAAVAVAIALPWTAGPPPPAHRPRVIVAALENRTGDPALDPLGHMAADWITRGIARTATFDVVASAHDLGLPHGHEQPGSRPADLEDIRRRSGAETVVTGAYYRTRDSIQFHVQILDAQSGNLVGALNPVAAPARSPLGTFEVLGQRIAATLDTLLLRKS